MKEGKRGRREVMGGKEEEGGGRGRMENVVSLFLPVSAVARGPRPNRGYPTQARNWAV